MSNKRKPKGEGGGNKPTRSRVDLPRKAAFECIEAVVYDDAYANLAMPRILDKAGLGGRDAAFATELAYGAIRMHGLYDAVIGHAASRPAEAVDNSVRIGLWLGTHQALGMRTPPHAAVSETVEQVRAVSGVGAAKFANAVMRRVTERSRDEWLEVVSSGDDHAALAIRHAHPEWVVDELSRSLEASGRADALEAVLEADNAAPRVTLVARPGLVSRDEVLDSVPEATSTRYSPYGVVLAGGAPKDVPAVAAGTAGAQDEGSQLAALALAHAGAALEAEGLATDSASTRWLDMCAGPGGKASLLAAVAAESGAHVDALELHEHRADLVRSAVRALPEGVVDVHVGDGRTWGADAAYDRVMLDAPCTGLGALRRRPEARWRKTEDDLAELTTLQGELLASAARLVAPDGVIAYITCSPVIAETRDVIEASGLTVLDARAALAAATETDAAQWGPHRAVQLWPDEHGTDAMFISLLAPREGR